MPLIDDFIADEEESPEIDFTPDPAPAVAQASRPIIPPALADIESRIAMGAIPGGSPPLMPAQIIPPSAVGGAVNALRRGVIGAQQIIPTIMAQEAQTNLRYARERSGIGAPVPLYRNKNLGVSTIPVTESRYLTHLPQAERQADISKAQGIRDVWSGVVSEMGAEREAIPKSQAQSEFGAAKSAGDKWDVFKKYPGQVVSSIVLESLPPAIAGSVLGAPGGPVGMAAGVGLSSGAAEFSSEFLNQAAEAGFDPTDEAKLTQFLDSPAYDEAFSKALLRGGIVGGVDAATAGAAGTFIKPALKEGLKKVIVASGKEAALQAGGGVGGEFLAQTATKGDKPYDWFDIAMEGVAELATGPAEVFSNVRAARKADAETPGQAQSQRAPVILPETMRELAKEPAAPSPATTKAVGEATIPAQEVTIKARTPAGEEISLKMDGGEAQRRFTQRKTVLEALRDCMGRA